MLIVCPSCASRYSIDDDKIGAAGRKVRCASCRADFFVTLADDQSARIAAEQAAAEAPQPAAPAPPPSPASAKPRNPDADLAAQWLASEALEDVIDEDPGAAPVPDPAVSPDGEVNQAALDALFEEEMASAREQAESILAAPPEPAPVTGWRRLLPGFMRRKGKGTPGSKARTAPQGQPARPGKVSARKRGARAKNASAAGRMKGPLGIAGAGIAALALLVLQRETVVRLAPSRAPLFAAAGLAVNVKGLIFTDVVSTALKEGEARYLVVEGKVVSVSDAVTPVPMIEVSVRGEDGRALYTWTTEPPRSSLEPGEALHFRTRLATPPEAGRDVAVRFTDQLQSASARR